MKSEPLLLSSIHLIGRSLITEEMTDADIIQLVTADNEIYYTPGTAAFLQEYKNSLAGGSWQAEFGFSFPGKITEEQADRLISCGAAVLHSEDGQTIVFHKNDALSNTGLKPDIQSGTAKTVVKYVINSLIAL